MPLVFASQILVMSLTEANYNSPVFGYTTCKYKHAEGPLRIKIVVEGVCPFSVRFDPTTGTWSKN